MIWGSDEHSSESYEKVKKIYNNKSTKICGRYDRTHTISQELMPVFYKKSDYFSGKSIKANSTLSANCNSLFIRKCSDGSLAKTEAFYQCKDRQTYLDNKVSSSFSNFK